MSEKKHKELRQAIGYKPNYKYRKYSILDRIYTFIKRGEWITGKTIKNTHRGQRVVYQKAKKKIKLMTKT